MNTGFRVDYMEHGIDLRVHEREKKVETSALLALDDLDRVLVGPFICMIGDSTGVMQGHAGLGGLIAENITEKKIEHETETGQVPKP